MLKRLQLALEYLLYFFTSSTRHSVHSPFVYDFTEQVLNRRKNKPVYHALELLRSNMLKSNTPIEVKPLGARAGAETAIITLKELVGRTSKSAKYCELLERICEYYQPEIAVEIGGALGISALYQAAGLRNGFLVSLEGNPKSVEIARYNAEKTGTANVQFIEGLFDESLPAVLQQLPRVDYVFFDGNHTLDATLRYFEQCLAKAHEGSIFIFDDIRWSDDMLTAWEKIKKHPRVTVSIDLFMMGLVFFRTGQEREHFTLRY